MIIGRKEESRILLQCAESQQSELVAVYGRRRIGKTFLVKEVFRDRFAFAFVGTRNLSTKMQLELFANALQRQLRSPFKPQLRTWFDAFEALQDLLENSHAKKKIIFLDEMPWLDAHKSYFVPALEAFWNGWAALRNDVMLIVCGSSTSWMVDKIFHNKGGLFNRVTKHIYLRPFTLSEVEQYLNHYHFGWDRYHVAQCYMTLGGVPFYLTLLDKSLSLGQNIDKLFFAGVNAPLRLEYDELYTSLFDRPEKYVRLITALCQHREGLTRNELMQICSFGGASLTKALHDLEHSDFIFAYNAFGTKSSKVIYRVKDFYTLFYMKFVAHHDNKNPRQWSNMLNTPQVNAWQGFGFELLCLQHLEQIKRALGINVMLNTASSWRSKDAAQGAQIDLVIDRADRIINLCEIKFSTGRYVIDKAYHQQLLDRKSLFVAQTRTRKSVLLTMITTYGVLPGKYCDQVSSQVTMEQLFADLD